VISGGDWSEDRLIPDLIRGFRAGMPVMIRHPRAIRPWQHVLEPLHGYLMLAEHALAEREQAASAFNFGPNEDDSWPVERIATKLTGMWGSGASWTTDSTPGVHEAQHLRLDSTKARTQLGWKPRLNIETALEWTMNWYQSWQQGADMGRESRAQIARFEQLTTVSTPA
jgi:CDP-glucose 4,6-dehydratase